MSGLMQKFALWNDAHFNAKHAAKFRSGWAATSRQDIRFFETNKVVFRYRDVKGPMGAPTLIFSVDPPVSLEQYDELLDRASKDFRVIVFELPGMGFSPSKRSFRFGFTETNDVVAAFIEQVAGHQCTLAFSCGAGLAALDLAHRRPELVSSVVLIQTTDVARFDRWKAARDPKNVLAKPFLGQLAMRKLAKQRMPVWFRLALGRKDHEERFCQCSKEALDHGALWSLASAFQTYLRPDLVLAPITQPALALWGETDGSHPVENRDAIRSLAPGVVIRSFDQLGHFPELQDPGLVYPIIRHWLIHGDVAED